tara:strand:- start:1341 stop:2633 length:1293 start_codon:yes stop_codon:yes gene_type:complete
MPRTATLEHAIVIKGPMQEFTRAVLAHYLSTLRGRVGVVFSHNSGCAGSSHERPFLRQLAARYPSTFDFVLEAPPPNLGRGYRNSQREACWHGVRHAIERWHPTWVLLHRADAAFVQPEVWTAARSYPLWGGDRFTSVLERLVAIAEAQPPIDSPHPSLELQSRRLGTCPVQYSLTTFYGRYSVDDHCMFGRASDVLEFWSLEAPYCRSCDASSQLDAEVRALPNRRACRVPGPEQENGFLWVERMKRRGWEAPRSALQLVRERLYAFNAVSLGYVMWPRWNASSSTLPCRAPGSTRGPRDGCHGYLHRLAATPQSHRSPLVRACLVTAGSNSRRATATLPSPSSSADTSVRWRPTASRSHPSVGPLRPTSSAAARTVRRSGRAQRTGWRPCTTAAACAATRATRRAAWWRGASTSTSRTGRAPRPTQRR